MNSDVSKEQMEYFWKKKEFVSFILCILVFLIHISSFAHYSNSGAPIDEVNQKLTFFFKESITRFAVPMYFILSGIAFFRDYENKKYFSKLKSRFFTLCIPYLIWNTLCMLFDIICSYTFISNYLTGRKLFVISVENIFKGIFLHENNIPFWYILFLICFAILTPLLNKLICSKKIGIASLIVLSCIHTLHIGGNHSDAIVYYLLGAWIGKHYMAFSVRRASKKEQLFSCIFLVLYVLGKNAFPTNDYYIKPFVTIVVFVLASYSLWNIVDGFMDKIKMIPLYSRSFAIFAMHTNVSAIICKILYLIFPRNGYFALPNLIITIIITTMSINVFCIVFERLMPSTYALFMGKGIKKKQQK